jgi:capsular exopolysaccharide synthesis family protein
MQAQSKPAGLLRTHALLITAVTLLTVVGALGVALSGKSPYVSESRVVVLPERVKGGGTPLEPNMGTEREIAVSGTVARDAARQLGLTEGAASTNLSVAVPVDTNVLEFSYSAPTADAALRGAQVFTEAYVDYRNGPRSDVAQIISPPTLPTSPSGPNLYLIFGLGLMVGLGFGVGIAYAWDRLAPRLRDVPDVQTYTGLSVLGSIPTLRAPPGERIVVGSKQPAAGSEAYGHLAARLLAYLQNVDARSVVITSPTAGAGKTTVTLNLGASLAAAGKDTVVLSVDSPDTDTAMHIRSGVTRRPGLQEMLRGKASIEDALHDTGIDGLRMIPAGGSVLAPHATLNIHRLTEILDELNEKTEVVLIDAPSVLGAADTALLAEQADLTVLVVDIRRGRRSDAAAAVQALSHVEERLSGCIVNDPGRKQQPPASPKPGSRKVRPRGRGSRGEGNQDAGTPIDSENSEAADAKGGNETVARLRPRRRTHGADSARGSSGSDRRRLADLQ